jgi:hypothetical protein
MLRAPADFSVSRQITYTPRAHGCHYCRAYHGVFQVFGWVGGNLSSSQVPASRFLAPFLIV